MNAVQRIVIAGAAAWLTAAGSTAGAQTQDFVSGMSVNAIVRDAPFSGEGITTVTQTLADGTRIDRTTTSKLYRDSAGRLRREQTIMGLGALDPSRESETLITIVDPVARLTYVLNPTTRMARRAPPPPPAPPPPGSEGRGRGVGGRQAPPLRASRVQPRPNGRGCRRLHHRRRRRHHRVATFGRCHKHPRRAGPNPWARGKSRG